MLSSGAQAPFVNVVLYSCGVDISIRGRHKRQLLSLLRRAGQFSHLRSVMLLGYIPCSAETIVGLG